MIATGAEGQANMTTSDQSWHEFDGEGDWLDDEEEEPSAGRRRKRHRGGTEEDEILDEEDKEDEAEW